MKKNSLIKHITNLIDLALGRAERSNRWKVKKFTSPNRLSQKGLRKRAKWTNTKGRFRK